MMLSGAPVLRPPLNPPLAMGGIEPGWRPPGIGGGPLRGALGGFDRIPTPVVIRGGGDIPPMLPMPPLGGGGGAGKPPPRAGGGGRPCPRAGIPPPRRDCGGGIGG